MYYYLEAIVIMAVICVALGVGYLECHSKAEKQGMECSWGPIQGCMVKMPDGSWMDYERLRYME